MTITADDVLAVTQAYKAACEARFDAQTADGEPATMSISGEILCQLSDITCKVWAMYAAQLDEKNSQKEPMPQTPKQKPKAKPSQAEIDEHFNALWQLYPSKRGKSQVSASRKAALYDIPVAAMEKAVKRYVGELEKKGKMDYLLNGSTWFNGRYNDYLDDANYNVIDGNVGHGGGNIPETPKSRFSALTPSEIKDLESRGIISPENESVCWMALTDDDKKLLRERGVI